jgi:TonB-linked SusC/RagA family outer membrane protein
MKNLQTRRKKILYRSLFTWIILCFLTSPLTVFAQTKTVTGTVMDETGFLIPGASVVVQGTTIGTVTGASGEFILQNVPESATLQISFLGYIPQNISVTGRNSIQVILIEDTQSLEEVVVIGYGTTKRANTVGSISQITADALADRPIARIENALQGQMAGVSVRSISGKPGADLEIRVRGTASITGDSYPLYVVDGVPVETLQGINPSDIESINVLKDAASAAIYGSRGSNGVVLITTKRGKSGPPTITLNAYYGVGTLERKVDVLSSDEWITFNKKWYDRQWVNSQGGNLNDSQEIRIQKAVADGRLTQADLSSPDYRTKLDGIKAVYGLYDPWWGTDNLEPIDWQDAFYQSAPQSDMQLSIAGATERINYSITGGIFDQDGLVPGSSFKRYSGRVKVNVKANDFISLGANLAPSYSISNGTNVDGKDQAVARVLSFPGWVLSGTGKYAGADPAGWVDGQYDSSDPGKYKFYGQWGPGANNISPYIQATGPTRKESNVRLSSSVDITLNLLKGLSVNGMYAWNYLSAVDRSYTPTWMSGTWDTAEYPGQRSSSSYQTGVRNNTLAQVVVNYSNIWGDHALDLMGGASQEKNDQHRSRQQQSDFPNDKTWVFNRDYGRTTNYNEIGYSANAMISYFGRANYTLRDLYILTLSVRRDGSSKFGPKNRFGNFPAISGAWKFSEENFMKDMDWLGLSKLRASWGLAGNDRISNASFMSNMTARNYTTGESQALANGYVIGNIANSMLGWESTSSTNIGLDMSFFRGRISFSADYYYKLTTDLLLNSPVSPITGFTSMMDNIGKVRNYGMEFDFNSYNISVGDFSWETSLNVSFNRNKIVELAGGNADIIFGSTVQALIQRVGYPINSYYLYEVERTLRASDFEADGITPKKGIAIYPGQRPGDTKWTDKDGDDKITAADKDVVGSYEPDFEWGLTNTFRYKNWDLSIFLNGRQGGELLSSGSRGWNRATNGPTWQYMSRWLYNAYWNEDEHGDGKTPGFFSTVTGNQYDTNWLYDATYIRIKNIRLGYNWKLKPNKYANNIRLYVSCDNVYLWDNYYPGYSPEGATQDNAAAEWGAYPLARTFITGINITF